VTEQLGTEGSPLRLRPSKWPTVIVGERRGSGLRRMEAEAAAAKAEAAAAKVKAMASWCGHGAYGG
jgi:hypothetical protein